MNKKLFDKRKFLDPEMYQQLSLFAQKEIIHSPEKSIISSINHYLTPILYSKKLNELNAEWLVTLVEKNLIPSGGGVMLCRYIGYLVEKNIINNDERIKRLTECKIIYEKQIRRGQISTLLTTPVYEEFKKKYGVENNKAIAVLSYPKIKIENDHVCNVLNCYMDQIKISDKYAISTKRSRLSEFKQTVLGLSRNKDIANISKDDILNYIKINSLKSGTQSLIIDILISLNKEALLKDSLLKHFLSEVTKAAYGDLKNKNFSYSKFIDYLPEFTEQSRLYARYRNNSIEWICFKSNNAELSKLLGDFFSHSTYTSSVFKAFFDQFEKSFKDHVIKSLSDLTYKVFQEQVAFFRVNFKSSQYISHLVGFYLFLLQKKLPIFQDINETRFLKRPSLGSDLHRNFDMIFYQPLENVPKSDKWVLIFNEHQCTNEGITASMTYRLDFTEIKDKKFRDALKHYIWYQDSSINNKVSRKKYIVKFLKFIDRYNSEKIKQLSKDIESNMQISLKMLLAYKNQVLRKYKNNRTILANIYSTRDFLKHNQLNSLLDIEQGYDYYLSYTRDTTYNNSKPIEDNHFVAIFNQLKEKSEVSVNNKLFMLIFYLLSVTELRPTNILTLRKDCVKEIVPDKYVIETQTKTSNKEIIQVPISNEVKKQVDEVIRVTESYREESNDGETNKYLFITMGRSINQYIVMSVPLFNEHIAEICDDLGITKYTASNIRDTHMTKAEEFIIQSSYSEMQQNVLSGHKSSKVDEQFYVKTEKRTMLQAVQGVRIGNEINEEYSARTHYREGLKDVKFNELLTSENFITTPEFLDYYNYHLSEVEKEIINIESEMDDSSSIERMSYLVNYRELLEGYRKRILDIKNEE
ncbi:hypothetical protein FPV21_03495 [Carnobacterium sp. PL12RED10]|uniref:hypothetical protein n=1 Tax=Carnobacterium sp. PL12RED10 TaxID=2592351 RepID=UPI0011ECD368|nr:hypothetical protein [Carnobacterium sp. PL12RED10]KAF3301360.1 hypothetical protein FPV21_03495 [Carnobacterium sp. PL12RED10]